MIRKKKPRLVGLLPGKTSSCYDNIDEEYWTNPSTMPESVYVSEFDEYYSVLDHRGDPIPAPPRQRVGFDTTRRGTDVDT